MYEDDDGAVKLPFSFGSIRVCAQGLVLATQTL
jgi:hypothetical protein